MARLVIEEREARSVYPLPANAGEVVSVKFVSHEYPKGLLLFEAPAQKSYLKMFRMNGYPHDVEQAKEMLRKAFHVFHAPCWLVKEGRLIVHPPVVDGYLVVDTDGDPD